MIKHIFKNQRRHLLKKTERVYNFILFYWAAYIIWPTVEIVRHIYQDTYKSGICLLEFP
jgi:hypothetical protein